MADINLTKEDLVSVITLIDVISSRGAFKGEELLVIGTMRGKFEKAVKDMESAETEAEIAELN